MKKIKKHTTFIEELVADVTDDYKSRREERLRYEAQWQLNSNFVLGNQYCSVNVRGEIEDNGRDFYWQEREVFNHIASILETRLAKLSKVRPKMSVRPSSGDDEDIKTASAAKKILASACQRVELSKLLSRGTEWSEVAGCVFYKISWDNLLGKKVGELDGEPVYEGDVRIDVCPPYEVFPDSLTSQDISDCKSIIHAKAVSVDEIERIWGVAVEPQELDVVSLDSVSVMGGLGVLSAVPKHSRGKRDDCALVIERYTRPTTQHKNGELVIVANGRLLHYGTLPYALGNDGEYDLPFVKQDAQVHTGCFYGLSVVERAIPVQRAYNAVKNRKHEFLNRIAMGVLAVEDGSVDTDNLESEGLSPGKILIYRQGSTPPALLNPGSVPSDFYREEDRLLNEFVLVSGVSEFMRSSSLPSSLSSGMALQLLLDQDDARLSATAERIRDAAKKLAQYMLRLYKSFAKHARLFRFVGEEGDVEILCWKGSTLSSDDVVFDTENELNDNMATRKSMMFELLSSGLLNDENGKLSDNMRFRVLDALGYGGWEQTRDTQRLQLARAQRENALLENSDVDVRMIDDHALHIEEHTRFMLSLSGEKLLGKNSDAEARFISHIAGHKQFSTQEAIV